MVIENKIVTAKSGGKEFSKTWLELIFICLESPPEKGFTSLTVMRKRNSIQERIESKLKLAQSEEFTDEEIKIIKDAVLDLPWAFNSKSLVEFIEFFDMIKK